ncbi:MAG: UDP-N-acetylmuramate dehydrogenase [Acidobacteriaceae bacterium]|nr:UDP-N-acetylmuramate dehydrogenase [Acidobacteriaceae bacterium]
MALQVREDVLLAQLTTFGVGGAARWFAQATTEAEVADAVLWAQERQLPLFVLGGGSNLLVEDSGFPGLVLRMEIGGVEPLGAGRFEVGAGVVWDHFVTETVERGCAGVECLAGIPGSVGGTPVQNVGAYGQDVSETIEAVRVYDREQASFRWLQRSECRFRYRESRFNTEEPGRFIVVRVRFQLREHGSPELRYAELRKRFDGQTNPSLREVSAAVREIRRSKGMLLTEGDPDCHSAGSFFRNPVVAQERLQAIAAAAAVPVADVPHWPAGEGLLKLPAAWLLERAGFVKGFGEGPVGISRKHTLALVNRGGATFADVARFQQQIVERVHLVFGVELVREPVTLR